jgi:solute carrier family 6 GABA transporter-like protein 1
VLSFAYPNFKNNHMYDPIMIYGFSINHVVVQMIVFGFVIPSWFNWIIPSEKVSLGDKPVAPMETLDSSQDVTHAVTEEGQLGHSNREFEYKK